VTAGRKALWLSGAVAAVSAAFLGAWQVGRGSAPTLAAALTFGGAVVTGAVALVGHLISRQANQRLDEERLREQERLRLDAAMQAGTLLASPDQPASAASGLLALTQLGQANLAVALLVDLWSAERSQVSTETAILVIDAALRSEQPNAQLVGAELLCRNATRLNSCQSLHWPSVIDGRWDPRFAPKTKFLLLEALLLMSTARRVDKNALRSVAVRLFGICANDPDPNVKGCVGTALNELIPALTGLGYTDFMQGSEIVTLEQLRLAAKSRKPNADQFLAQVVEAHRERLAAWSADVHDLPLGAPVATAPVVAH
jgi:hypothetical protein